MKMNKSVLALALAGMMASGAASAALSQGTVGATSTGSLDITLVIPALVVVNGLTNINLGTFDGVTAASGSSNACVRTNNGTYNMTATSANGSFVLKQGTNTIAYSVTWGGTAVTYNTALTNLTAEATTLGGACGATATGKIGVGVTAAAMQAVPPATYTDTLIVTVSAN